MDAEPWCHILVVDGNAQLCEHARAALAASGYTVVCARNARDALRLASVRMPELLLTAVTLADSSGLDLASRLREVSPSMAVVYMSTASDAVQVGGALDARSGSLWKPFVPARLVEAIDALVGPRFGRVAAGGQ